jgi:ubiquitin carboxyl-terminal hydrolase 16/45
MEEKDVIKALSPPKTAPGSSSTNRRIRRRSAVTMGPDGEAQIDGENVKDRLIPFSDALFGGSLVSVVICEGCKSVSHTYEGFMDISLSMKNQQPRVRKVRATHA